MGVALGQWKTVTRIPTSSWGKFEASFLLGQQPLLGYKDAAGKSHMQPLVPAPGFVSQRIVAVTRSGQQIPLKITGNAARGVPVIEFPNPRRLAEGTPKDVSEFWFQTREFAWTEFPNVALEPKS